MPRRSPGARVHVPLGAAARHRLRRRRRPCTRRSDGARCATSSRCSTPSAFLPPTLVRRWRCWVADYYVAGPGDVAGTRRCRRACSPATRRTFTRRRGRGADRRSASMPPTQAARRTALRAARRRRRRRAASRRRQREALTLLAGAPAGLPASRARAIAASAPATRRARSCSAAWSSCATRPSIAIRSRRTAPAPRGGGRPPLTGEQQRRARRARAAGRRRRLPRRAAARRHRQRQDRGLPAPGRSRACGAAGGR